MDSENVKMSIVIPVYNKGEWLRGQLESILSQNLTNFECILVDDGSTDDSGVICDEYSEKYPQFQTIHQKNAGVSNARNTGLKLARGQYIGFMDADDEICPDMYESLTHFADKEQLDIAICAVDVRVNGKSKGCLYGTGKKYVQSSEDAIFDFLLGGKFTYGACNKIYRRKSIEGVLYDPEYKINEDKWFMFNALFSAKRVGIWDHPFFIYHRRENSASTAAFSDRFFDVRIIAKKITDKIKGIYPHMLPLACASEIDKLMELLRMMCRARACKQYPEEIDLIRKRISDEQIYYTCKQHLRRRVRLERDIFLKLPGLYTFTIPILYKLIGR